MPGIWYSRDGGISWLASGGTVPTTGKVWEAIASSLDGRIVVAGYHMHDSGCNCGKGNTIIITTYMFDIVYSWGYILFKYSL